MRQPLSQRLAQLTLHLQQLPHQFLPETRFLLQELNKEGIFGFSGLRFLTRQFAGILNGGMGAVMGGMMGAMLGVMLQYLYEGSAITITSIFMGFIYLASIIGMVRLVHQGAAAQMETDLVCKMKVSPTTALQHVFQNQTFYFCAASCKRAFAENPEMFVKKVACGLAG